jgi:hypothetical protein
MEKEKNNTTLEKIDHTLAKNYQEVLWNAAIAAESPSDLRVGIMAFGALLGIFLCVALLSFFSEELPRMTVGVIAMIAGIFTVCLRDVYWFEFRSSRGSR